MTDKEYLEKMIALTDELNRTASANPYDPDAYNSVIDQLNSIVPPWEQRRRRRPWAAVMIVIFLVLVLLYIVWEILFNLKIMDSP